MGAEPEAGSNGSDGLGLGQCAMAAGKGGDATTSGIEGAWTAEPDHLGHGLFRLCCSVMSGKLVKSHGGRRQHRLAGCQDVKPEHMVVDAHDPSAKKHAPMMTTADMSLRMDPDLREDLASDFHDQPGEIRRCLCPCLVQAVTHRDMGPEGALSGGNDVPSGRPDLAGSGACR